MWQVCPCHDIIISHNMLSYNIWSSYNTVSFLLIVRHCITPLQRHHYNDVIISMMVFQFTRLTIVHSSVYSGTDRRKFRITGPLCRAFTSDQWISPHKEPVTWKMFPFDDVIMDMGCAFVNSRGDLCSTKKIATNKLAQWYLRIKTWIPWTQSSWGQHGAHLRPTGPRWAPCWPHEPCYLGKLKGQSNLCCSRTAARELLKWLGPILMKGEMIKLKN